jgi:hypothetical protein
MARPRITAEPRGDFDRVGWVEAVKQQTGEQGLTHGDASG